MQESLPVTPPYELPAPALLTALYQICGRQKPAVLSARDGLHVVPVAHGAPATTVPCQANRHMIACAVTCMHLMDFVLYQRHIVRLQRQCIVGRTEQTHKGTDKHACDELHDAKLAHGATAKTAGYQKHCCRRYICMHNCDMIACIC